jgi:hypothetical protein
MVESEDESEEEEEEAAISLAKDQLPAEVVEAFNGNPPIIEDEAGEFNKENNPTPFESRKRKADDTLGKLSVGKQCPVHFR